MKSSRDGIDRDDTTLLRVLAILLIVNSHLELFYPRPWLAGDGLIGGNLFFLISGFSLMVAQSQRPRPFAAWYWRRVIRIYPSLWIVLLVGKIAIESRWREWNLSEYAERFLWPTTYTYITGIVPFCALFYWIARARRARPFAISVSILAVIYVMLYAVGWRQQLKGSWAGYPVIGWLAYVFSFMVMLMGGWMGLCSAHFRVRPTNDFLMALGSGLTYLLVKIVVSVLGRYWQLYFVEHAAAAVFLFFAVKVSWNPVCVKLWRGATGKVLVFVSGLTLEIYLVHEYFIVPRFARLGCPLNVLAVMVVSIIVAVPLAFLANWIQLAIGQSKRVARPTPVK